MTEQTNLVFDVKRKEGESTFDYTQRIRMGILEQKTIGGLPDDPDDLRTLSILLNDIDKQEVTKTRLALEDKALESDRAAQELIGKVLTMVGNSNPFRIEGNTGVVVDHKVDLPEVTLVPGELDGQQRQLNYDSFMKEYREKNPKEVDTDD